MTERAITWEFFERQYKRLAYLPGFERVEREHWAEWYTIFSEGYYPHELVLAIDGVLLSPNTEFFPGPGKVLDRIGKRRTRIGGNSWDSVLAKLEQEAELYGEIPPQNRLAHLAKRLEAAE